MRAYQTELARTFTGLAISVAMAAMTLSGLAQTPSAVPGATQPTILYGAAYYNEYMPADLQPGRLDRDVALMKEAGISVVRMG
ncbi:MAG: hypothetical protein WA829_07855, partial [Candidatus Acidiferrum sp.]